MTPNYLNGMFIVIAFELLKRKELEFSSEGCVSTAFVLHACTPLYMGTRTVVALLTSSSAIGK